MDRVEWERLYTAWQEAEHALDVHEDTAWHATLRPDGSYLVHPGAGIDRMWLATESDLRAARDDAHAAWLDFARANWAR
jgi:hypothetical protein